MRVIRSPLARILARAQQSLAPPVVVAAGGAVLEGHHRDLLVAGHLALVLWGGHGGDVAPVVTGNVLLLPPLPVAPLVGGVWGWGCGCGDHHQGTNLTLDPSIILLPLATRGVRVEQLE